MPCQLTGQKTFFDVGLSAPHQRVQYYRTVVETRAGCFLSQQDLALHVDHDEPLQPPALKKHRLTHSSGPYDTGADRRLAQELGEIAPGVFSSRVPVAPAGLLVSENLLPHDP